MLLDVVMCGSQAWNFWAPLRPEIRFSKRMPPADFRPAHRPRRWRGHLFAKGIAFNLILRTTRANWRLSEQWMDLCRHYRDRFGTGLCPHSVRQLKHSLPVFHRPRSCPLVIPGLLLGSKLLAVAVRRRRRHVTGRGEADVGLVGKDQAPAAGARPDVTMDVGVAGTCSERRRREEGPDRVSAVDLARILYDG